MSESSAESRRTFVIKVDEDTVLLEDVRLGERARLPGIGSIEAELDRRLTAPELASPTSPRTEDDR